MPIYLKVNQSTSSLLQFLDAQGQYRSLEAKLPLEELLNLGAIYLNGERIQTDQEIQKEDTIRLYPYPQRHSLNKLPSWPLIVEDCPQFVIANKPPGLPTHATSDNFKENLHFWLEQKLECRLWVTHRLDKETTGLILLAKCPLMAKKFHSLLKKHQVTKIYRSLNCQPLSPSRHRHYHLKQTSPPHLILDHYQVGVKECRFEVLSSQKYVSNLYLHESRLITGRTHQLRAQMAYLQSPILGDSIYSIYERETPHPHKVSPNDKQNSTNPQNTSHDNKPLSPILPNTLHLQAFYLSFYDSDNHQTRSWELPIPKSWPQE